MIEKIKETEINAGKIANLPTRPNSEGAYGSKKFTAEELKARYDVLPLLAITKINEIVDGMRAGGSVAKTMKFEHNGTTFTLQDVFEAIFNGTLGGNLIVGEVPLNLALATINATLSDEIVRATEKDATFEKDISDLREQFDETVAQVTQSVNDAFDSLISYANSLAREGEA